MQQAHEKQNKRVAPYDVVEDLSPIHKSRVHSTEETFLQKKFIEL